MRRTFLSFLCFLGFISKSTFAQKILIPNESAFEKKWVTSGVTEFSYNFIQGNNAPIEVGNFVVETKNTSTSLSVITTLTLLNTKDTWKDTSISDAKTYKPIYRSSFNVDKEYVLDFGTTITGYYLDKKTKKRTSIKDASTSVFFESYTYPHLLAALPLEIGYRNELPVYDYKPENSDNVKKSIIEETRSGIYKSSITGEHKVWQVTVFETATNQRYIYSIDKVNRKLYSVEIFTNEIHLLLISREIDFNPIKSAFNKEETLKLIKDGNSVITGQAFARDNQNQGLLKGMAILNVNKKQYAAQGTGVVLIPNTDYFKEWKDVNESLGKKKKPLIPMPREVRDCIKTTTIYDDEGHFEFTNLLPGEYFMFIQFGYVHTATAREVIGYTDTYINGNYQGSSENTRTYTYGTNADTMIDKIVTIKKNGEKVSVKLKKTR